VWYSCSHGHGRHDTPITLESIIERTLRGELTNELAQHAAAMDTEAMIAAMLAASARIAEQEVTIATLSTTASPASGAHTLRRDSTVCQACDLEASSRQARRAAWP